MKRILSDEELANAAAVYGFVAAAILTFVFQADATQALLAQKLVALAVIGIMALGLMLREHVEWFQMFFRGGLMGMTALPGIELGRWASAALMP